MLLPTTAFASHGWGTHLGTGGQDSQWTGLSSFFPGFCNIMNWVFGFVLILAVIMVLYAAFLFLSSGGDSAKVTRARSALVWGLVGVAVAFLARALVFIVGSFVGATITTLGC